MAVEEGEQKRSDVGAVDVGIGHDDDFVIAELFEVEIVRADPAAKGGDHRPHFSVLQDLLEPRFLDVKDLTSDRQNRLEAPVAARLRRAARRVSLDNDRSRKEPDLSLGSR